MAFFTGLISGICIGTVVTLITTSVLAINKEKDD